jgi:hypothetical protein
MEELKEKYNFNELKPLIIMEIIKKKVKQLIEAKKEMKYNEYFSLGSLIEHW